MLYTPQHNCTFPAADGERESLTSAFDGARRDREPF